MRFEQRVTASKKITYNYFLFINSKKTKRSGKKSFPYPTPSIVYTISIIDFTYTSPNI